MPGTPIATRNSPRRRRVGPRPRTISPTIATPPGATSTPTATGTTCPTRGMSGRPYDASNPGWDPYGNGYWMNSPNYGYMWISGEPWGFMPYQCGAWNYYSSFGWGWAPGGFCNPWWGGGGRLGRSTSALRLRVIATRCGRVRAIRGQWADMTTPQPLIAVNRRVAPGNTMLAPRDKTGSVLIAGSVVRPLKPIQARLPYNHSVPGFRHASASRVSQPSAGNNPRTVFQGGSAPRVIDVPARPGNVYTPAPQTRPGTTYTPQPVVRPNGGSYAPPPTRYSPPPSAPVRSSPPPSAPVRSSPPPSRSKPPERWRWWWWRWRTPGGRPASLTRVLTPWFRLSMRLVVSQVRRKKQRRAEPGAPILLPQRQAASGDLALNRKRPFPTLGRPFLFPAQSTAAPSARATTPLRVPVAETEARDSAA